MTTTALVQARIDKDTKEKAAHILSLMGITTSDAIRLLLSKVAREGLLPAELTATSQETLNAIKNSAGES